MVRHRRASLSEKFLFLFFLAIINALRLSEMTGEGAAGGGGESTFYKVCRNLKL